jgi:hypothetical protein
MRYGVALLVSYPTYISVCPLSGQLLSRLTRRTVYISWSIFTSLAPSLFYFSVWELGIAGHELALLSTLAPILLTLEPFLAWARTKEGLLALHVLSFVGLLAYISDKPLARLFMISFATAVLVIKQAVEWTTEANNRGTQYQGVCECSVCQLTLQTFAADRLHPLSIWTGCHLVFAPEACKSLQ